MLTKIFLLNKCQTSENESNLTLSKDGNNYTITATTEQTNQYYKVEAKYNNKTGYISKVIISDAT